MTDFKVDTVIIGAGVVGLAIAKEISDIFEVPFKDEEIEESKSLHDVPGDWFRGPF